MRSRATRPQDETMRTFIAFEISDAIKTELSRIQSHLKYAGADIKWVDSNNIHITLKFLGDINDSMAAKVCAILDNIAKGASPFTAEASLFGAFPDIDFPKVVWAGLGIGSENTEKIFLQLDEELSNIGFQKEKRAFTSHLTLGRVRTGKNILALKEKLASAKLPAGLSQKIGSIVLFKSTLTPSGSIYTKIHEALLGE